MLQRVCVYHAFPLKSELKKSIDPLCRTSFVLWYCTACCAMNMTYSHLMSKLRIYVQRLMNEAITDNWKTSVVDQFYSIIGILNVVNNVELRFNGLLHFKRGRQWNFIQQNIKQTGLSCSTIHFTIDWLLYTSSFSIDWTRRIYDSFGFIFTKNPNNRYFLSVKFIYWATLE